jgi:hypothetical protein
MADRSSLQHIRRGAHVEAVLIRLSDKKKKLRHEDTEITKENEET